MIKITQIRKTYSVNPWRPNSAHKLKLLFYQSTILNSLLQSLLRVSIGVRASSQTTAKVLFYNTVMSRSPVPLRRVAPVSTKGGGRQLTTPLFHIRLRSDRRNAGCSLELNFLSSISSVFQNPVQLYPHPIQTPDVPRRHPLNRDHFRHPHHRCSDDVRQIHPLLYGRSGNHVPAPCQGRHGSEQASRRDR